MRLEKLYQLFDSMTPTPFIWNDEVYKAHVESVCMILKEYETEHWKVKKLDSGNWEVRSTDDACIVSTVHNNLFNAVKHFVDCVPRPELV